SKTLSHDLDHHDRHGHRDRVLSLRAKLRTRARQDRCVERDELAWCRARGRTFRVAVEATPGAKTFVLGIM
ncbi:MAG: hypothetical protein WBY01_20405, partial [Pseudolabrys sp.]